MRQGVQGNVAGLGPAAHRVEIILQPVGVPVGAEPGERILVLADDVVVADAVLPRGHELLADPQEDALAADLAGRHPGGPVPGQGRPGHQVGVVGVGRVQPGEPGQGAHFPQPLGLHYIGEKAGQRRRHAVRVAADGEVVGRLRRDRGGEHLPFGGAQVRCGRGPGTGSGFEFLAPLGDRVEHLVLAPLVQGLELRQAPREVEGLGAGHVLQVLPELLHLGLQRAGADLRHRQRGQRLGEPGVGRADHDYQRPGVAGLEGAEVRVPSPAGGQRRVAAPAHRLTDVPRGRAVQAADLDVGALVAAVVGHPQLRVADRRAGAAVVRERGVGEVIEMPVHAGQHEPGGDGERPASAARAVVVVELRLVRAAGLVVDESPDAGVDRGEPAARGAAQPLRERDHRHADAAGLPVRVGVEAVQPRRRAQLHGRGAQQPGDGGLQPGFGERRPVRHRVVPPVI